MFRIFAGSLIILLCALLPNGSSADGVYSFADGRYWYCQVVPFSNHKLTYFSGVFGPTATRTSEVGDATVAINREFAKYMLRKYAALGNGHCGNFESSDEAATQKKRNQELINSSDEQFIETGWQY
jgi:hypothetical protein